MISSPKEKQFGRENEAKQCSQINEAVEKLHKVNPNGARDTEWGRSPAFSKLCASKALIDGNREIVNEIDLSLSSTEPRSTFIKFRNFVCSQEQERSFCLIYWLYAIFTNAVHSLRSPPSQSKTGHIQNLGRNTVTSSTPTT